MPISLRVERGDPDDAEIVALLVVLAALASTPAPEETPARSSWANPAAPGQDAWRLTALPH